MEEIKLGLIGYNEGNGHPYSFSAIINGYSSEEMKKSPYPVIFDYLLKKDLSEFGVGSFKVTHVWTPNPKISKSIAKSTFIENIVDNYEEMANEVNAIIIARDDVETHKEIGAYFLERGLKVFIDKPLCKTLDDLSYFIPFLVNGQLMSCSGLRFFSPIIDYYKDEFTRSHVLFANAVAPIDWLKYGIHILEGLTAVLGADIESVQNIGHNSSDIVKVKYHSGAYAVLQVSPKLSGGLRTAIYSSDDNPNFFHYNDNFSCFKRLLESFYEFCVDSNLVIEPRETINLIKALIGADISKKQNSRIIYLNEIEG